MKPYAVTYCRDGWPKQIVIKRFKTEKKASAFIGELETRYYDDDVKNGAYGIDGPAED